MSKFDVHLPKNADTKFSVSSEIKILRYELVGRAPSPTETRLLQ